MKTLFRSAIAIAALAGTAALVPQTASAGVGISIGIGVPGYSPYGPGYEPYDGTYYYDPIYIGDAWYHGPYRWRMYRGERQFWVNGRWHRNEWHGGAIPGSITFRNGGYYRDGRNSGFGDADRINARFHTTNQQVRDDRADQRSDRMENKEDKQEDRQDNKQDKRDRRDQGDDNDRPHN